MRLTRSSTRTLSLPTARAIDAASGGNELDTETLARFVRIVRVATGVPDQPGRVERLSPLLTGKHLDALDDQVDQLAVPAEGAG